MTQHVEITCKKCKRNVDSKEVKRKYGKESRVYLLGFCSAKCYTDYYIKK